MTDQCAALVSHRSRHQSVRPCKYGVIEGSIYCRFHTRRGAKPKPQRCEQEVFTYSQRGHHQCYLTAVERVDGEMLCARHAAIARRELERLGGREKVAA